MRACVECAHVDEHERKRDSHMRSRGLVVDDELGVDLVTVVHYELAVHLIATRRND